MVQPTEDGPLPPNTAGVPNNIWEAAVKAAGPGASASQVQSVALQLDRIALVAKNDQEFVVGAPRKNGANHGDEDDQPLPQGFQNAFSQILRTPLLIGATSFSGATIIETYQYLRTQIRDPAVAKFATGLTLLLVDRDARTAKADPHGHGINIPATTLKERSAALGLVRRALNGDERLMADIRRNDYQAFMQDSGPTGGILSLNDTAGSVRQLNALIDSYQQRERTFRVLTTALGHTPDKPTAPASPKAIKDRTAMAMGGAPAIKVAARHHTAFPVPRPPGADSFS